MKTLYDICQMISDVEEALAYNQISFSYDNLMCAMKPGHPADILDDILSIIGWEVLERKTPEKEKVKKVYELLKDFQESFKIKELTKAINALEEYLTPPKIISFPILIDEAGESFVEYPVTSKELKKIRNAMDEGYDFEEAPGLKGFYGKLMKAAKKKLVEDLQLTGDGANVNDYEFCVDYPEELEEEENG